MIRYERVITDEEQKILENDLLDVKEWIDKAIEGKINACMKRLAAQERNRSIADGALTIPAKDIDLVRKAFVRIDYKPRRERETLDGPTKITR